LMKQLKREGSPKERIVGGEGQGEKRSVHQVLRGSLEIGETTRKKQKPEKGEGGQTEWSMEDAVWTDSGSEGKKRNTFPKKRIKNRKWSAGGQQKGVRKLQRDWAGGRRNAKKPGGDKGGSVNLQKINIKQNLSEKGPRSRSTRRRIIGRGTWAKTPGLCTN